MSGKQNTTQIANGNISALSGNLIKKECDNMISIGIDIHKSRRIATINKTLEKTEDNRFYQIHQKDIR